jgi:hypothetical protein
MAFLEHPSLLTPMLALVAWSLVVCVWMVAARIPVLIKAGMSGEDGRFTHEMDARLPPKVRQVGHNYNHLMEQPTLFYALAAYSYLAGRQDGLSIGLAWAYVGLRVLHSFAQGLGGPVPVRFMMFALSTLVLVVWTGVEAWALFA